MRKQMGRMIDEGTWSPSATMTATPQGATQWHGSVLLAHMVEWPRMDAQAMIPDMSLEGLMKLHEAVKRTPMAEPMVEPAKQDAEQPVLMCEVCGKNPAVSFSFIRRFADDGRQRTIECKLACFCTSNIEYYYICFYGRKDRQGGFFDSDESALGWIEHMQKKTWFEESGFWEALGRVEKVRQAHQLAAIKYRVKDGLGYTK
jgi:hypothetical protein